MIDVEHRARRAGEAARTEAAERGRHLAVPGTTEAGTGSASQRRSGVRRPLVAVIAGGVALLLVALLVGELVRPPGPMIEPATPEVPEVADLVDEPVAVDGVLPVPPVGEAIPAYLDDGTPVFVSHPAEGEVYVVGAVSRHMNHKLISWCSSSGWFEDLYHGARYNAWGDYAGGPAALALSDYASALAGDGASVRVTGRVDPARPRTDQRAEQPQRGPNCVEPPDGEGDVQPTVHAVPTDVPAIDGTAVPTDQWVWGRIRLGGIPGDPRVCDVDGTCRQASPRPADVLPGVPADVGVGEVVGLVRRDAEGVRILVPATPERDGRPRLDAAPEAAETVLLPLPEPGDVVATWWYDEDWQGFGAGREPVFVSRDLDGEVVVLDAISPHQGNMVAWCPATETFDDGFSFWNRTGGYGNGPSPYDLRRYPSEIARHGETAAVRVTGELESAGLRSASTGSDTSWCDAGEWVHHQPGDLDLVVDRGSPSDWPLGSGGWIWVRMAIAEVDGQLRLCAIEGPEACGATGPESDPSSADCIDDMGDYSPCPPAQDPVVVSGVGPTDGVELLLVRSLDGGREVEVRQLPSVVTGP